MKTAIKNQQEYEAVMARINTLMKIGEANLEDKEFEEIRNLSLKAQAYEKSIYTVEPPATLEGMIELRMYEMRLKQKDLADKLNMSNTKLSLILNGKQKPDLAFIKAIHTELNVPADFILEHI